MMDETENLGENETIEISNMKCELNILSRSHGSALLSVGNTVVAAAVYGPVEVRQHKLLIDRASIDVCYHCRAGPSNMSDKLYESTVYDICDSAILSTQYPRTAVVIVLQEMQCQKAVLSTAINSACLALMHSGICMNYLFAAVTCIINENGTILTIPYSATMKDYQEAEENNVKTEVMFVFESVDLNILTCRTRGPITESQYHECLVKCKAVSSKIFEFYKKVTENFAPII